MKYIFLLVGIKGQNIPVGADKEFLHRYLREHYGNQTLEELRLAFDLAIQGRLKMPRNEVKCYENFSTDYVASILNAFRDWAGEAYRYLEPFIPAAKEVKALPAPEQKVSWRGHLEDAYQHFLSFGPERVKHFPVGFYDQLVEDGALKADLFRRFMKIVRQEMIGEAIRERTRAVNNIQQIRTQLDNRQVKPANIPAAENNCAKMKSQIKITELQEAAINEGKKDGEIEVAAKQRVVWEYFKELKEGGFNTIYTTKKEEDTDGQATAEG